MYYIWKGLYGSSWVSSWGERGNSLFTQPKLACCFPNLARFAATIIRRVNHDQHDDFIWFCCRESLCNHCYQRRRILTAIWAKEFLDRLWSTGNKASAKCFVQKCSWLFKMDHWILWSSQNWAKHTGVHRQLYPTIQPCVYKGLRTPVEMRIWKSEACGFTGVFLLSLFGKDFPIWLEGNVTNATMNHYLGSYLVVRCLGHFRCSFFWNSTHTPQVKSDSQLDPLKRRHSWKFWSGINLVKVWVRDILMHVSLLDHVVLHGFYEGGREPEKKGSTWHISKVQWQAR